MALLTLSPLAASTAADFDPADHSSWLLPRADLYDVTTRGELAWAVGYWGTALRSDNGGQNWVLHPTPTSETLYAVSFGSDSNGWAVGAQGALVHSTDGGRSWSQQRVLVSDEFGDRRAWGGSLFDVSAVSALEAWAVGDFGMVLHTVDGDAWEQVPIPEDAFADENIPDRIFNAVTFTDRDHGWIVGEFGTTLRTSDAGGSWTGARTFDGAVEDVYLMALAATPDGRALADGVGGVVLTSSDRGASWSAASLPNQAGLFGAARRGERALVVGDRGVIFATRDGGATWFEPAHPRLFNWLRAAALAPNARGLIVGESGLILFSTDGGESWQRTVPPTLPPASGTREAHRPAAPSSQPGPSLAQQTPEQP